MHSTFFLARHFGSVVLLLASLSCLGFATAQDKKLESVSVSETPITQGLKICTCGHSFYYFMPPILAEMAKVGEIKGHEQVGQSYIGGSRIIQHWFDIYDVTFKLRPAKVDHNAITFEQLKKLHEPYFAGLDEHVRELNKKIGKEGVFIVPVGHAVNALRDKVIAGQSPGITMQEDLFADPLGHVKGHVMALNAYCHYAVIYCKNPVGLPVPSILKTAQLGDQEEKLNTLLQELAWEAVTQHPLSGVKAEAKP